MMNKSLVPTLLCIVLLTLSPASGGQQEGSGVKEKSGPGSTFREETEKLMEQLPLEQRQALERVIETHGDDLEQIAEQLQAKTETLDQAIASPDSGEEDIDRLAAEVNELRSRLFDTETAMRKAMRREGFSQYTTRTLLGLYGARRFGEKPGTRDYRYQTGPSFIGPDYGTDPGTAEDPYPSLDQEE